MLTRRAIYENPASPCRELLKLAGCEFGDLTKIVRQYGIAHALGILLKHGVYLTVDEFNRRMPVVRGSATISLNGPAASYQPCE
jgi:hypothetical protein